MAGEPAYHIKMKNGIWHNVQFVPRRANCHYALFSVLFIPLHSIIDKKKEAKSITLVAMGSTNYFHHKCHVSTVDVLAPSNWHHQWKVMGQNYNSMMCSLYVLWYAKVTCWVEVTSTSPAWSFSSCWVMQASVNQLLSQSISQSSHSKKSKLVVALWLHFMLL